MEERFNRQCYSLGKNSINIIKETSILVLNFSSLSLEIIKNLILMGIKNIDIELNEESTVLNQSNIYYSNIINELKNLNPSVIINNIYNTTVDITKYNMIILTNHIDYSISELCRKNNIGFIMAYSLGLSGCVFNDFGKKYTISDIDGLTYKMLIIDSFNNDEITFKDKHLLENNDYLLLNENIIINVTQVINPLTIKININLTNIKSLIKIKTQTKLKFSSLRSNLTIDNNNQNIIPNYKITNREKDIFILYRALFDYLKIYNMLPSLQSIHTFKKLIKQYSKHIDIHLIDYFINTIEGDFLPISSIIGGIVSQEVIKYITKSFIPIHQWLTIDCFELLYNIKINKNIIHENKYNSLIHIFGNDILTKIQNSKPFIIGVGAIGCEILKQLMALGTKNIIISDMDNIEISNLSRQFLFNDNDIHKFKSIVASDKIQSMNCDVNCKAFTEKLCHSTENIFNADFYSNIDFNLMALDNIEARLYINSQSIKYKKPLIDSGTTGLMGSVQVILPYLTETYESNKHISQENIPLCTIKSFPYKVEHNIQWATELFYNEFNENLKLLNHYCNNTHLINDLTLEEQTKLKYCFIKYKNYKSTNNFDYILSFIFYEYYINNITNISKQYKEEDLLHKNLPIYINVNNEINKNFIKDYLINGYNILNLIFDTNLNISNYELLYIDFNYDTSIENIIENINIFNNIQYLDFNKDNLLHINFLTSITNLRNIQYNIKTTDNYEVMLIAGKIIPALITTTSLIAGFQIIEYLKYIIHSDNIDLELFNNKYVNLGNNYIDSIEPNKCKIIKIGKFNYSEWNNIITVNTNITQDIINYLQNYLNTDIEFMTFNGNNIIYDGDDVIIQEINFDNKIEILVLIDIVIEIKYLL